VEVEEGWITWEDREPTPDPEEVNRETLKRVEAKLDDILSNQQKLMEEVAKLKEGKGKEAKKSKANKKATTNNTNKE